MKRWILILVFVLFFISKVSALGVSPGILEIDFAPGQEYEFTFSVISESSDKAVDVSVGGDLVENVKLSAKEIAGS